VLPQVRRRKDSVTAQDIRKRLKQLANPEKAEILRGFFKTGPGQYGEGDIFYGITVPLLRKLAKECANTPMKDALALLRSPVHEERVFALFLLVADYHQSDDAGKDKIYRLYLKNIRFINNWDLVDLSAPSIVGVHLVTRSRKPLYKLARSRKLWEKRVAILSTFAFIKQNDFADTLKISKILRDDDHDLIHKAVGWMLREVGKRDLTAEENFLRQHYKKMPRTMLRYAIERFAEIKRKKYLNGKI
jgi:3-methyladenine DNA glycosylase AlkD